MMAVEEELRDRKSYYDSPCGGQEYLYQTTWELIHLLSRPFTCSVIKIHPLGTMNTRFQVFCQSVMLTFHRIGKNFNLLVTLQETGGNHQSHWDSSFGDHSCLY